MSTAELTRVAEEHAFQLTHAERGKTEATRRPAVIEWLRRRLGKDRDDDFEMGNRLWLTVIDKPC